MTRTIASLLVGALGLLGLPTPASGAQDSALSLREAMECFHAHELREMSRACQHVLRADPEGDERAQALAMQALIDWRYDLKPAEALDKLESGIEGGVELPLLYAERARVFTDTGDFAAALESARAALAHSGRIDERGGATRRWLEAVAAWALEEAEHRILSDEAREALREALDLFRATHTDFAGVLDIARPSLQVALLLGDGEAALLAWRSYYLMLIEEEDPGLLDGPLAELTELLPRWSPGAVPPEEERERVALALLRSALVREAEIVASGLGVAGARPLETAAARELLTYARFTGALERLTNEHYRRTAIGRQNDSAYRQECRELYEALWEDLELVGRYEKQELFAVLGARFRADIQDGRTAGYADLHYGHRVVDDELTIQQYDEAGQFRFVSLDGMISNGFQSWAWDFRSQHGGSVDGDKVLQFRPPYANGLRGVWASVNDPALRAELERDLEQGSAQDRETARRNPVATFHGLLQRLRTQGTEEVLEAVRAEGHEGKALERAFIARYRASVFACSILAHEGRHAIDRRVAPNLNAEESEYRAKLSEVAFAPNPRLALGSILRLDGDTPHARANRRIAEQLVEWMEAHRSDIDGLDDSLPLLPQVDRLTNDQLRAAFASLDPLARGS